MQPEQNTNTNTPAPQEKKKFKLGKIDFSKVKSKLSLRNILIIFLVIIMGMLGYLSKKYVYAASVNGVGIPRLKVIRELERRLGKEVVENLINTELVKQEARNRKLYISDDEIKSKMTEIDTALKGQGQSLDVALKDQNLTTAEFKEILETNMLLEKMISGTITVTDQEVDDYITKNKEVLPKDLNPDDLKKQVKDNIKQQKLNTESANFLTNLRTKANVVFWTNY